MRIENNKTFYTLKEITEIMPELFPRSRVYYFLRERDRNGFEKCLVKVGRKFYVDLEALCDWSGMEVIKE